MIALERRADWLSRFSDRIRFHVGRIEVVGASHWSKDLRDELARRRKNAGLGPQPDYGEREMDQKIFDFLVEGKPL